MSLERADRIRRRAAAGSLTTTLDGSELSENSNSSSTFNDDAQNSMDTSDIHQKGRVMLGRRGDILNEQWPSFSSDVAENE